jgi:protein-tyrosine phosphatase
MNRARNGGTLPERMRGFIDLHCHWIANIDDGVRAPDLGVKLLRGLHALGFSTVVATPHMRPGMFDNDRPMLEAAFANMAAPLARAREEGTALPEVHLSSEHWFDDTVYERLRAGQGLPYPSFAPAPAAPASATQWAPPPKKRGVLVEFTPERLPINGHRLFFGLHRAGLFPVIAHPERYQPVWKSTESLEPYVQAGAHLLLDLCSLVGKYGRAAQRSAEQLLDEGAYLAACTDAHKPEDLDAVGLAIERLKKMAGQEGVDELLVDGPRQILHLPSGAHGEKRA